MNPLELIEKYYDKDSRSYYFLVEHGKMVAKKALEIAKRVPEMQLDLNFLEEAAMLHDIGIFLTNAPEIGCSGNKPYITHVVVGADILRKENLPKHALICEKHSRFTKEEIIKNNLPLPRRDFIPQTVEEEIICLADKFYSKDEGKVTKEKSIDEIRAGLSRHGQDAVAYFDYLLKKYEVSDQDD
jgi:uncharacterized protein